MSIYGTPVVGPFQVWTQAPTVTSTTGSYLFPWGSVWNKEPRLIPLNYVDRPGSMGSASFRLLQKNHQEPNSVSFISYSDVLVAGQYVCITAVADPTVSGSPTLDPTKVLWWGWLNAFNYESAVDLSGQSGSASALGLGYLLEYQQVTGWRRQRENGTDYAEEIGDAPTANMGDALTMIIGNAVYAKNMDDNAADGYVFSRKPLDCAASSSNMWTRWRLLRHIVKCCKIPGLPRLTLSCADGSADDKTSNPTNVNEISGYLNDTATPEVYDLSDLTLKGAIDMCATRARLMGWKIQPAITGTENTPVWNILIYSMADSAIYGVPINKDNYFSAVDTATVNNISRITVTEDATDLPDEVWIEGAPIICAGTVGFPDGTLFPGWTVGSAAEDAYRTAASGDAGYAALTVDGKQERDNNVRNRPGLRDIFTKYSLYSAATKSLSVKSPPGDGSGSATQNFIPYISWDGTALTATPSDARGCPYLPTAKLLRTLPWPEGVDADGTDTRDATTKCFPTFTRPGVYIYDQSAARPWYDLGARNGNRPYPGVSLDVEDRGAAIRLILGDPTRLARNHWISSGVPNPPSPSAGSPEGSPTAVDYSTLVISVALESAQRLKVSSYRPGVAGASDVRRRLVLRDERLQLWLIPSGLVLGVKANGQPDRVVLSSAVTDVSNGYYTNRNDYPTAEKRLKQAAGWAFRARKSVQIEMAKPDTPPAWAVLGGVISSFNNSEISSAPMQVNTCIEEISVDCQSARLTVSTTIPPMPGFGLSSSSPSGGGAVSLALGGTVATAVQAVKDDVAVLQRDTQKIPVIVPRVDPVTNIYGLSVTGGNVLDGGQQGIKYQSGTVTSVPSAYDPNVTTAFIDGIGRGQLQVNGAVQTGYVLIVNDDRGSFRNAVVVGDPLISTGSVQIQVGSSGVYVTAYTYA